MRPLHGITLQEAGFRERHDLQEWVMANPSILGGDVMIVTAELDRWQTTTGIRPLDRLDILGLRSDGTLLVAELKRGPAPDTVDMQAVKYAALCGDFTASQIAEQLARFETRRGRTIDESEALERLLRFAPDLPTEGPRIAEVILIAASFSPVVTTTALFLDHVGLPMRLVTIGAYRTESDEVIVRASTIYPLPELEKVGPRNEERRTVASTRRGLRTVQMLLDAGRPAPGTRLQLRPRRILTEAREQIEAWFAEDPTRAEAFWEPEPDPAHPVRWTVDGNRYSLTGLIREIALQCGYPDLRVMNGPGQWAMPDGQGLWEYAMGITGGSAPPEGD